MPSVDIESEVRYVLKRHQPRYDERGPRSVCTCNSILSPSSDAVARHQAKKVAARLAQYGIGV